MSFLLAFAFVLLLFSDLFSLVASIKKHRPDLLPGVKTTANPINEVPDEKIRRLYSNGIYIFLFFVLFVLVLLLCAVFGGKTR